MFFHKVRFDAFYTVEKYRWQLGLCIAKVTSEVCPIMSCYVTISVVKASKAFFVIFTAFQRAFHWANRFMCDEVFLHVADHSTTVGHMTLLLFRSGLEGRKLFGGIVSFGDRIRGVMMFWSRRVLR